MSNDRKDPYAQFNFLIELDKGFAAGFTEASGLTAESDVIEYRLSSDLPTPRKLPGLLKYGNITLKRGYTNETTLWEWRQKTLKRNTAEGRRDGAIILQDEAGDEVMRWTFRSAWVSKYEGPSLNSTSNEAAIESIEIVHEGLEFSKSNE